MPHMFVIGDQGDVRLCKNRYTKNEPIVIMATRAKTP